MFFMRIVILINCLALVACGGSSAASPALPSASPTPNATLTPAPVGAGSPKIPLRGLIDMQDIHWNNIGAQPVFDMSNVNAFPGLFGGIVINATWNQMQPMQGGAVDFSAVDAALAQIRTYNAANSSAPLGAKLRIYGGANAPAWADAFPGGPITVYRNPAGCNGKVDFCPLTEGPFWTTPYINAWRAFQAQVAAKYDSEPLIVAVAVTSCASQTDEPFVPSIGPISKANLAAAGFNDTVQQACLAGAPKDYAGWQNTDVDFTFNSYDIIAGGQDESFTKSVMLACRSQFSYRCVLDNHALTAPVASTDAAVVSDISSLGGLINFQTQAPEGMGCLWPETVTQGILEGARAIELWPESQYQGFDTLTFPEVSSLRALFYNPIATPTPLPSPLPTPCTGYN